MKHWLECLLIATLLVPAGMLFFHSNGGDEAIYFTFFKNFFSTPFSFQPDTVSFGASSPLHVVIFAPIYYFSGEYWIGVAKYFNLFLVIFGTWILNRAINGNIRTACLLGCLVLINVPLLNRTMRLYESGITFFLIAALYYYLKKTRYVPALLISGSLYLVRPELVLVTVAVDAYILLYAEDKKRTLWWILASGLPSIIFHIYMMSHGLIIPSSILGRLIRSMEDDATWIERFFITLNRLVSFKSFSYILALISVCIIGLPSLGRKFKMELLLVCPIIALYILMPPGRYLARYLLPISPILCVFIFHASEKLYLRLKNYRFIPLFYSLGYISVGIFFMGLYATRYYLKPSYGYDDVLLKDLAVELNPLLDADDKVLLYEIQGQYYINNFCYSLDGIVGSQIWPVFKSSESLHEFIKENKITYIVTMNSFNYRKLFKDTFLPALYTHDLENEVSSSLTIENMVFIKMFTNPQFSNKELYKLREYPNLNIGESLRRRVLFDSHPRWNSVYHVEYR